MIGIMSISGIASCRSKSVEEVRYEKLQESLLHVETIKGEVVGYVENGDDIVILYFHGDTLLRWDVDSLAVPLYDVPESLMSGYYTLDTSSGNMRIKFVKRLITDVPDFTNEWTDTPIKAVDIIKSAKLNRKFNMLGPWIIIAGDFIANIHNPNELLEISDLGIKDLCEQLNDDLQQAPTEISDIWTGNVDYNSIEGLKLTIYGTKYRLPGFETYAKNIPSDVWFEGGENSEESYATDYHFSVPISLGSNSQSLHDFSADELIWRDNSIPMETVSANGMSPYYKERERELQAWMEECRIKEEEERKRREEEMIQQLKAQSITLWTLVNAYEGNVAYGKSQYPTGKRYIMHVNFDKCLNSNVSQYKYRFLSDLTILKRGYFYSNDDFFISQKFPFSGYIECYFDSYNRDYVGFSDEVCEWTFYFADVKILAW